MPEPNDTPPDELVGGKYRLTRLLGRGGMGSVWEGVHTSLGTHVAVKFIETEYVDSAEARSRFDNEARAAAKLVSKHVVKVHDHGVMNDRRPYIVMEYLAGEPLDARINQFGRLSLQETATIVLQVARALTKAHEVGIVHRDLKPENVFLVKDDEDGTEVAKVVDFGIAKFTDGSTGLSSSTRTGSVLGTPYYMSPEQARGLRSVDHRSDLWSLVVIAYRCVVGKLPFVGEAVGDLLVQLCVAPTPVASQQMPGIPPAFDAWVERGLAKDPAQRFQSAAELADALAVVAGIAGLGRPRVHSMDGALNSAPTVSAPLHATPHRVEGVTAAPFTTQNAPPKKKSLVGVFVGAAVAAVALFGIVVVVAVSARSGAAAASSESTIVAVPGQGDVGGTVAAKGPPAEPSAALSVAPSVAPPPSASAVPEPAAVAEKTPRGTQGKPTSKPASGGTSKPTSGGKPTTGGKPGGTDVGY